MTLFRGCKYRRTPRTKFIYNLEHLCHQIVKELLSGFILQKYYTFFITAKRRSHNTRGTNESTYYGLNISIMSTEITATEDNVVFKVAFQLIIVFIQAGISRGCDSISALP